MILPQADDSQSDDSTLNPTSLPLTPVLLMFNSMILILNPMILNLIFPTIIGLTSSLIGLQGRI
jgi:uncharacterized membrane protein